ncbi:TIGR03546 family protein [Nitrospina gracilis]|uniref:TIGR03546 family protein n=1 Tax=Nitrospina gracilis TaxID=35801 RepID=UPI001F2B95C9|nr:uncharacterized protein (TIGR03546 family) [Nitrospina gracilis Nb-211]
MFSRIIKILKALNSNQRPWQISVALVLGAVAGLTPLLSLHNLVVLLLAFFLNVNFGMFLLSLAGCTLFAFLLDPLFHQIGYALLTAEGLHGFWTQFFSCPIFLLGNLNNTIVMGSLVVSLGLGLPLIFVLNKLIVKYRLAFNALIDRIPFLKFLKIPDAVEMAL